MAPALSPLGADHWLLQQVCEKRALPGYPGSYLGRAEEHYIFICVYIYIYIRASLDVYMELYYIFFLNDEGL